ncbi:ABC transporter ATP-binding protein [Actinomycetaceae bacterium MB13-C1-2]|nr:ABC transporter ATP-binding protein [Actinomycetaceae bacterium MB13-C1-2]
MSKTTAPNSQPVPDNAPGQNRDSSASGRAATEETLEFLRSRAEELKTTLPPLGKTPRRWLGILQAPTGKADHLGETPWEFLKGVVRTCRKPIVFQTTMLTINAIAATFLNVVVGRAVDAGIDSGLNIHVWQWVGVFALLVIVLAVTNGLNQVAEISAWLRGALGASRTVAHRVARAGRSAKQDKPAGDVVTAILNDSDHLGAFVVFVSEVIAALVSFVAVAVIMLTISPRLGLVIIIGFPLAILAVTALAGPIQRKLAVQREEQGKLTTISTDAVVGLRVLRGIGGEDYYNARYKEQSGRVKAAAIRVASNQALLAVMRSSVPMLFLAVVAGFGSMMVFEGEMTPGDLLTFAGLTAFLANPLNVAAWAAQIGTRAWVGVKKLAEFNALQPPVGSTYAEDNAATDAKEVNRIFTEAAQQVVQATGEALPTAGDAGSVISEQLGTLPIEDSDSGIAIRPRVLTALVAPSPDTSAEVAKRMARIDDKYEAKAGGVDLRALPLETVRQGILLAEADAQLFRGTLHSGLRASAATDPPSRGVTELVYREHLEEAARQEGTLFRADRVPDDPRLAHAMYVADAPDVLDSLAGGMAGWLTERGRNLSGGQRQRVALARAVYADAPVLIAIEPTSAVDSHTEERISSRIRDERQGKTTVVVTASPLWLEKCDEIVVMDEEGREVARGSHSELRRAAEAGDAGAQLYRRIVQREAGEEHEAPRS